MQLEDGRVLRKSTLKKCSKAFGFMKTGECKEYSEAAEKAGVSDETFRTWRKAKGITSKPIVIIRESVVTDTEKVNDILTSSSSKPRLQQLEELVVLKNREMVFLTIERKKLRRRIEEISEEISLKVKEVTSINEEIEVLL